ncbi:SH3 domain-containing protein [Candidatus Poribacteria bacterium]|nr:SH3 domain-containing protein [Candidatus Poribacteria bacterium]
MNNNNQIEFAHAWLTGRETNGESNAYGEVVVPFDINIRENIGSNPNCGKLITQLSHGQRVSIIEKKYYDNENRDYYKIRSNEFEGWVSELFLALNWSCFTFIGKLHPEEACIDLNVELSYAGMDLVIRGNGFAIVTEGDPKDFNSIQDAAIKYGSRIIAAQTPLSAVPLNVEFINWVEVPSEFSGSKRTIGFVSIEHKATKIVTNDNFKLAQTIVPLMAQFSYLDIALKDFIQAMTYPEHSLIFLSRCIESIEYHFAKEAAKIKGYGKEKLMQERLGLNKEDVDYVTKRANQSHMRHATSTGKIETLSSDELSECFNKTGLIIGKFATYLTSKGRE